MSSLPTDDWEAAGATLLQFIHHFRGRFRWPRLEERVEMFGHENPTHEEEAEFGADGAQSVHKKLREAGDGKDGHAAVGAGGGKLQLAGLALRRRSGSTKMARVDRHLCGISEGEARRLSRRSFVWPEFSQRRMRVMKRSVELRAKESKLSEAILQRLNLYALAAGAAGIGALTSAPSAQAQVSYIKIHADFGSPSYFLLDAVPLHGAPFYP
jgi:hypothetical protein